MQWCILKQIQYLAVFISKQLLSLRSINNFCHRYGVCLWEHSTVRSSTIPLVATEHIFAVFHFG